VTEFINKTDEERLEGKVGIDIKEQELQTAEKASKDQHLTGALIKNTASNLFDHSGSGGNLLSD